jgi:hypothetical protein
VGLPEATPGSKNENYTNDALLSRIAIIKEGDYIFFYITKDKSKKDEGKELQGIWRAIGQPFYDITPVWEDKTYPFRCRIESTEYSFKKPLRLNDIFDLRNSGKIWTFALNRASGTNAMFSLSDIECDVLLQEYLKINPFTINRNVIMEPYPVKPANLFEQVHRQEGGHMPSFESSLMAMLARAFVEGNFQDVFGNYSDYLCYVPTNFGTEIDILLFFNNPHHERQILSYDILEVKSDRFDADALRQLIGYESWFIHKKVQGDMNMVRVSAIAKRFDPNVVEYVENRRNYENKEIKLLEYNVSSNGELVLRLV